MTVPDKVKRETAYWFHGYYGLKRSLAAITVVWSLIVISLIYTKHRFVPIAAEYVICYWSRSATALLELVLLAGGTVVLLKTDILKRQYTKYFGYIEHLEPSVYRREPSWTTAITTVVLVLLWLPFIDLYTSGVSQYGLKFFSLIVMFIRTMFGLTTAPRSEAISRLNSLRVEPRYFNPAGLGARCPEVGARVSEITQYTGPLCEGRGSHAFIAGHKYTPWKGVNALLTGLGSYLGCDPKALTLHERTTDAVQFAVDECCNAFGGPMSRVRIAYTDAEYPGLVALTVRKAEQDGRAELSVAEIMPLIAENRESEAIANRIVDTCEASKAQVVLLSHVAFASGYVVNVGSVMRELERRKLKPVLIVDGAQAVGNLGDLHPAISAAHYYAACSQKWLCTSHNLGFLVRNEALLNDVGIKPSAPARPFSRYDCEDLKFGLTIPIVPYYELTVLLEKEFQRLGQKTIYDHNARLAELFVREVTAIGYRVWPSGVRNGIVGVVLGDEELKNIQARLDPKGFAYSAIPTQVAGRRGHSLRFSFHFYHDSHDVYELIKVVNDSWRAQEIARGRRGYSSEPTPIPVA
jgi:selenocysteine lyase/cysteine desulfurase